MVGLMVEMMAARSVYLTVDLNVVKKVDLKVVL